KGKWLYLTIPKMEKPLKVRKHRQIDGVVKSIIISLSPSGKVHVSILVKKEIFSLERKEKVVAIDIGLKDFAVIVDSQGVIQKVPHPRYLLRTEKLLKRQQKKLSRKEKFSKNYQKQARKVAKLHEKVKNQRMDFLHKLSSAIIHENQVVVVEDLNIKGLLQNDRLSKAISDSGWAMFLTFLSYKAQLYGREVIFADRFYPSSKLCSFCGYKNTDLKLSDREWICPICGTKHDRDINAGINLLRYGLAHLTGSRAGTVRTYACGDCSGGGTSLYGLVYEPSVVEAGSSSFQ
ncbi:MAG: RNA-guided endonuclease TnpB family protein, partial [Candidatus Aenigmatarchaeota archaeon]